MVIIWAGNDDNTATTPNPTTPPTITAAATTSTMATNVINPAPTTSTTTTTTTTTVPLDCTPEAATGATTVPGSTNPTLGRNSKITTAGLGKVFFGMSIAQAEKAAGTPMIPCAPVSSCYIIAPASAPDGISFVVKDGTIERVDIIAGPITTRSGVGIGTADDRIIELFGSKIERSVNDDSSVDLIFVPVDADDARFRVIFTIRDGVVDSFRSGRTPLVFDKAPCAA